MSDSSNETWDFYNDDISKLYKQKIVEDCIRACELSNYYNTAFTKNERYFYWLISQIMDLPVDTIQSLVTPIENNLENIDPDSYQRASEVWQQMVDQLGEHLEKNTNIHLSPKLEHLKRIFYQEEQCWLYLPFGKKYFMKIPFFKVGIDPSIVFPEQEADLILQRRKLVKVIFSWDGEQITYRYKNIDEKVRTIYFHLLVLERIIKFYPYFLDCCPKSSFNVSLPRRGQNFYKQIWRLDPPVRSRSTGLIGSSDNQTTSVYLGRLINEYDSPITDIQLIVKSQLAKRLEWNNLVEEICSSPEIIDQYQPTITVEQLKEYKGITEKYFYYLMNQDPIIRLVQDYGGQIIIDWIKTSQVEQYYRCWDDKACLVSESYVKSHITNRCVRCDSLTGRPKDRYIPIGYNCYRIVFDKLEHDSYIIFPPSQPGGRVCERCFLHYCFEGRTFIEHY